MPQSTPLQVSSGRSRRAAPPPRRVRLKHQEKDRLGVLETLARRLGEVRPEVARFAVAIEEVLRKHDPVKGGVKEWRKLSVRDAYVGLFQEVQELEHEVDECAHRRTVDEVADLGASCVIVHDLARRKVSRS